MNSANPIFTLPAGFGALYLGTCLAFGQFFWSPTTSLPIGGDQFDPVEANGYVYVGGGYNGQLLTNVFAAKLNPDGSLGSWMETIPLPQPVQGPGMTAYNGWVYVALDSGAVFRAQSLPNGSLGNWIPEPPLEPSSSYRLAFRAYQGFLYAAGRYDGAFQNVMRYAAIHPDGSLQPWSSASLPAPIFEPAMNFYHDRVYLAGGVGSGNLVLGFSFSAPVFSDGVVGAWRQEASVPVPLWMHSSMIVSNQIYLLGGLTDFAINAPSDPIYQGTISPDDGSISNWVAVASMPSSYSAACGVVYSEATRNVYVLGGRDANNIFTSAVFRSALGPQPNHAPVALSQTLSVIVNASLPIALEASDADDDPLSFRIVNGPTNGTLAGVPPNVEYRPNPNYVGPDAFTFVTNDGQSDSAEALVSLTVSRANQLPVPVISITPLSHFPGNPAWMIVIAPDNQAASVLLDASPSHDADQDALQFTWSDGTVPLGEGVLVTANLAVGTHFITLEVSDGIETVSASVTLDVIAPARGVGMVIQMVQDSHLAASAQKPLLALLNAATASFVRGNTIAGLNQLAAFQNKVRAQIGRQQEDLAADLIGAAAQIVKVF